MRILLFILLIPVLLACEDRFRYECQDPVNFNRPQCNPPACEADGTCTRYLINGEKREV
jgi:hypothetical protein